jgi:hypothetical protein
MSIQKRTDEAFEPLAHAAMDSLFSDFGFRCTASSSRAVRYESGTVFFEFGHGARDSEVFARVGRLGVAGVLPAETSERLDVSLFLAVADLAAHQALNRTETFFAWLLVVRGWAGEVLEHRLDEKVAGDAMDRSDGLGPVRGVVSDFQAPMRAAGWLPPPRVHAEWSGAVGSAPSQAIRGHRPWVGSSGKHRPL